MNQYRHLSAFPENREVLQALKARGMPAGILSNGDPEMLARGRQERRLRRPARPRAQRARACASTRPTRPPTRSGPQALGLPAREILFVSSNGWDAIGATWFGYTHAVGQPRRPAARAARHRTRRASAAACATCSPSFPHPEPRGPCHDRTHHRPPPAGRHRAVPLHRGRGAARHRRRRSDAFWQGFDAIVHDLAPKNAALLAERDRLQAELDAWHKANPGPITRHARPTAPSCEKIGYLVPEPAKRARRRRRTSTPNWRCRPARSWWCRSLNARYALNAANARWGSLYDALYGTDAIPETGGAETGTGYNPVRGAKVIEYARHVLDQAAPLKQRLAPRLHRLPRRRRPAGRHAEGRQRQPA